MPPEAEAERLHALAVTDGLTQVANHRHFQDRLREEFRRAQRYDDPLALILADLDHFKNVNDNFGHPVGDEVLVAMAACLKYAVRETDFVARYGGEEFAVLLPKTHLAGALTVAERISTEMKQITSGARGPENHRFLRRLWLSRQVREHLRAVGPHGGRRAVPAEARRS